MTAGPPAPHAPAGAPMWLSHHPPDDYDRCLTVAGRPVCRRCAVLYPVALLALSASAATGWSSSTAAVGAMAVLPIPAVIEWWAEHLGRARHDPRRLVATTVAAGTALGIGFDRYLGNPADRAFWAMVLVYGGACAAIAAWRLLDERAP